MMKYQCNKCGNSYPKHRDVPKCDADDLEYVEIYNICLTNIGHVLCGKCIHACKRIYVDGEWIPQIPLTYSHTKFEPVEVTPDNIVIFVEGSMTGRYQEYLFFGLDEFKLWINEFECSNVYHQCHKKNCLNHNYKASVSNLSTDNYTQSVINMSPIQRVLYYKKENSKKSFGPITLLEDHLQTNYWKPNDPTQFLLEYKQKQVTELSLKKKKIQDQIQNLINESGKLSIEEHMLVDEFSQLKKLTE